LWDRGNSAYFADNSRERDRERERERERERILFATALQAYQEVVNKYL